MVDCCIVVAGSVRLICDLVVMPRDVLLWFCLIRAAYTSHCGFWQRWFLPPVVMHLLFHLLSTQPYVATGFVSITLKLLWSLKACNWFVGGVLMFWLYDHCPTLLRSAGVKVKVCLLQTGVALISVSIFVIDFGPSTKSSSFYLSDVGLVFSFAVVLDFAAAWIGYGGLFKSVVAFLSLGAAAVRLLGQKWLLIWCWSSQ
jgi:hypothetical protein